MIDQMQEELMRLRVESVQAGAVNYVYIFEDGTVRQSTCKPEESESRLPEPTHSAPTGASFVSGIRRPF